MDFSGNPFGAPPPQPMGTASNAANPFGATSEASNPWGVPPNDDESVAGHSTISHANPFGSVPPSMHHGSSHSTYSAPPPMSYQNPLPAIAYAEYSAAPPSIGNPFGAPQHHSAAVVLAPNPSSPYAMPSSYGAPQSIVPASQSSQPWAIPNQQQQLVPVTYDPFAKPPPLQQQQPPAPPEPHEIDHFFAPAPPQQQQKMEPVPHEEPSTTAVATTNGYASKEPPPTIRREDESSVKSPIQEAPDIVAPPPGTLYPPQIQYGQRPDVPPDRDTSASQDVRNPYSPLLAREAPPGASPLPKAELVRKRGFALARISFRTIVMKKWKQTFWVQYGPHTMLWFRSQADFDDWLNNPYHMQTERNFLIKLAVNFVHDLYKPNVRGYQVTQCRTKGYGNKIVRQFKLERWMDYGPTIAAAFGSYDPNEVDALREAIVECMRNTPLEGGIRATGAVRQPNPSSRPARTDDDEEDEDDDQGLRSRNHEEVPPRKEEKEPESVSEEADLLDVNNWDDVPRIANEPHYGGEPPYIPPHPSYNNAPGNPFGLPPSMALVPTTAAPSYPGAPMPQQQPLYGMASSALVPAAAPPYPGAPPQQPYLGATYGGALQPPQTGYSSGAPQWNAYSQAPTPGYAQLPADPWAQPRAPMQPPQY